MRDFNNDAMPSCDCPVPCNRIMYDAAISYASVSNHDTERLIHSGISKPLQERFVKARETNSRVNEQEFGVDKKLIEKFDEACLLVNRTLEHRRSIARELSHRVHEEHHHLMERVNFHQKWGVEKVVFIMHHDFVRGYDVRFERTFSVIEPFYLEVVAYCEYAIGILQDDGIA